MCVGREYGVGEKGWSYKRRTGWEGAHMDCTALAYIEQRWAKLLSKVTAMKH